MAQNTQRMELSIPNLKLYFGTIFGTKCKKTKIMLAIETASYQFGRLYKGGITEKIFGLNFQQTFFSRTEGRFLYSFRYEI